MKQRNPYPAHLTGAELQTMREVCNLTREELGELAGVAARTIKHWESGRAGVPADVAALLQESNERIDLAASLLERDLLRKPNKPGKEIMQPVFIRFHNQYQMSNFISGTIGNLTAEEYNASIIRARNNLLSKGIVSRVVWFDADSFADFMLKNPGPEADRQWAADQVQHQARAHRADQPPPGV